MKVTHLPSFSLIYQGNGAAYFTIALGRTAGPLGEVTDDVNADVNGQVTPGL